MRALVALALVPLVGGIALADSPREVTIRVTATATSAIAKHPAWRAIGQITAERWGWCPDHGEGVGESITFAFDDPLPLTELRVVAGMVPEWGGAEVDHGLPERVEIKTDAQTFEATLKRRDENRVPLSGKPVRAVTLKILAVQKGKVAKTCLNSVNFAAANARYRAVYGFDAAALKALPGFARALDAAWSSCDATVLGASVRFPLKHEHETIVPMGVDADDLPDKDATYRSARELVAACRRAGSPLQLGLAGGALDVDVADDIAHPFSETAGAVRIGDWQTHAWWLTWSKDRWQLTRMLTSEDRGSDPASDIAELAGSQIDAWNRNPADSSDFTPDATLVLVQQQTAMVKATEAVAALSVRGATSHQESDVAVTFARDRRSAVLSFVTKLRGAKTVEYRVSEVVVRSDGYWKIAAGIWSEPKSNDLVNKAASAGTIAQFARIAPPSAVAQDPVTDAFFAMQKGPLDTTAAARKDLIVFGSGPGERTVGGAKFARPWAVGWANHVPLDASGVVSKLMPKSTIGWVATDIMLEKRDATKKLYLIPFRIFLVFDRTIDGTWSLLHAHLATVAP